MWTGRYVLDPADDWGKISSHLLDRGSFFSSPDPSEEGQMVDEEYDLENIWDSQENENVPGKVLEETGPHVSLEEVEVGRCTGEHSSLLKTSLEKKAEKPGELKKFEGSQEELSYSQVLVKSKSESDQSQDGRNEKKGSQR